MVSRRDFFKGIGASAALSLIPGAALSALISDPRVKAWVLLDESEKLFKATGKSPEYFAKANELFKHLAFHFKPSNPPSDEVMVQDCRDLLHRTGKFASDDPRAHWRTCYNSTFAIMIVRDGLKNRQLPMLQAANWKPFAENYTSIVMAA